MRWWLVVLLLLPSVPAVLVEDPEGDVAHRVQDQDVTPMETPEYDLVAFEVLEDPDGFTFRFERAAPAPDTPEQGFTVAAYLTHGTQEYRVSATYNLRQTGQMTWLPATAYRIIDGQFQILANAEVAATGSETTFRFDRALFIDESGTPPTPGVAFTEVRAQIKSGLAFLPVGGVPVEVKPWTRADFAPDEGGVEMPILEGLAQEGATLTSGAAFRASNGESGVFYTNVTLRPDQPGAFVLSVRDVPAGWQVRLPFTEIDVDDAVSFPVELTVPFVHQHGGSSSFTLEARNDAAHAALAMGIYYVDPPQPSGHHSRVWIHSFYEPFQDPDLYALTSSRDEPGWPFFSTLEDDPNDLGRSIEPSSGIIAGYGVNDYEVDWRAPLAYGLRMGLNVTDASTAGMLQFDAPMDHGEAQVTGWLRLRGDDSTEVATFSSAPFSLAAGTTKVDVVVAPVPGVYPYAPETDLVLDIRLTTAGLPVGGKLVDVYLLTGSWFDLPLAEYSDSIADASGFVQPEATQGELAAFDEPEAAPKQDSPGISWVLLGAGLLALAHKRK